MVGSEGLFPQKQVRDRPRLVEVLAAPPGSSEVPLEPLRGEQTHDSAVRRLQILQTLVSVRRTVIGAGFALPRVPTGGRRSPSPRFCAVGDTWVRSREIGGA